MEGELCLGENRLIQSVSPVAVKVISGETPVRGQEEEGKMEGKQKDNGGIGEETIRTRSGGGKEAIKMGDKW